MSVILVYHGPKLNGIILGHSISFWILVDLTTVTAVPNVVQLKKDSTVNPVTTNTVAPKVVATAPSITKVDSSAIKKKKKKRAATDVISPENQTDTRPPANNSDEREEAVRPN